MGGALRCEATTDLGLSATSRMVRRTPQRAFRLVGQLQHRKRIAETLGRFDRPEMRFKHIPDDRTVRASGELAAPYLLDQPAVHVAIAAKAMEPAKRHDDAHRDMPGVGILL